MQFPILELTAWQNTSCSTECDPGTYNRTRKCLHSSQGNIEVDPEQCGVGTVILETHPCNIQPSTGIRITLERLINTMNSMLALSGFIVALSFA